VLKSQYWARFGIVYGGDWQPRSLAGAFYDALPLEDRRDPGTIRQRTVARLANEIITMDEAYGAQLSRRFLALDPIEVPGAERVNLSGLTEWAKAIVQEGVC
jgi:CRISPR system Cascade subunit CasC